MNILRRGKLGAALLFVLIFVAVVGGMSWATASSVKLAEKSIEEERRSKIDRALTGIEQYIAQVLATEAARPYTHYHATYYEDPLSIRTRDGQQLNLDPNRLDVEVSSPLLPVNRTENWRPYDWIDIYFQIEIHQKISSPQFPDDPEHIPFYSGVDLRTRFVWDWLQAIMPTYPLAEKVTDARKREWLKDNCEEGDEIALLESGSTAASIPSTPAKPNRSSRSLLNTQAGYIPAEGCIEPRFIARNMPTSDASIVSSSLEDELGVTTKYTGIAPPFWLDPAPKLAFVREIHADADVLRQGFIGDWERLKPHLMARIQPTFPAGELLPEIGELPGELASNEYRVPLLPLILRVPDFAAGARTEALQSTRGMLLISWLAALAVLLVAGWGVMNLVALTERRMQFAYAVTHELRTPLTTFRLYSDMLSAGLVPEDRKQEYLDTLNRESARLSTMVESVLEYARLENRQARLHLQETDGTSLLHTVGETLDKRCAENGIEGRKVNEIRNGLKIRTDVDLVSQITGVLINNACRHARSAKAPAVLLRLGGENGRVTLDVVDSGPGVDRADSRRIFKPFRRGRDADKTARGGIGLGLALARNWASLLGGRLDLVHRHDPELGGAHFRLSIPSQTTES
jgi:signal transduction histidine kinase